MIDDDTLDRAAAAIHDGVADYEHGPAAARYRNLLDEQKHVWRRVAEHALESSVDNVLLHGRPVWWVAPYQHHPRPVTAARRRDDAETAETLPDPVEEEVP